MKWIALIAVSAALGCAAVSTDVAIKEIEHQLYIQGAAAAATDAALRLLQDQSLTTDQLARVAGVAQNAALRNGQAEMMRTTMTALSDKGLPCDELRNALALGGDSPRDANANRNVREALQYQWTTLDWRSSQVDRTTFDEYLNGLTQRTNLAEVIRVQTSLLRTIMQNWLANADAMGISSNMVTRHYQRLLNDLAWTDAGYAPASVARALERWYATSREYIIEDQPYLAMAAVNNLARYASFAALQLREPDVLNVQLSRLHKTAAAIVYDTPKLERALCAGAKVVNRKLRDWNVSIWQISFGDGPFSAGLMCVPTPHYLQSALEIYSTNMPPKRICDLFSIGDFTNAPVTFNGAMWGSGGRTFECEWDLSNTLVWTRSANYESVWATQVTFTGHWLRAVWQQRFDALSNSIWQLDAPLNEIRKYVAATATPAAPAAHADGKAALRQQAEEALRLFLREGPLCTTAAVAAAKTVLALEPQVGLVTPDVLNKYPTINDDLRQWVRKNWINSYYGVTASDYARWMAAYDLPEIATFLESLRGTRDANLKRQYIIQFYQTHIIDRQLFAPLPDLFQELVSRNPRGLDGEQLIVAWQARLQEALKGSDFNDYSVNFAVMLELCLPTIARYVTEERKNIPHLLQNIEVVFGRVNMETWSWKARARVLATHEALLQDANTDVCNYNDVVQHLADLANGLREDAGLPPSTNNWIVMLNAEVVTITSTYQLAGVQPAPRPIVLKHHARGDDSLQININGKSHFVKSGDVICASGTQTPLYKVGEVAVAYSNVYNPQTQRTQNVDVTTVAITDAQTGENFTLTCGAPSFTREYYGTYQSDICHTTCVMRVGTALPLPGADRQARVVQLDVERQTATFVIGGSTGVLPATGAAREK